MIFKKYVDIWWGLAWMAWSQVFHLICCHSPALPPLVLTGLHKPSRPQPCPQTLCPPLQSSPRSSGLVGCTLMQPFCYSLANLLFSSPFRWSLRLLTRYALKHMPTCTFKMSIVCVFETKDCPIYTYQLYIMSPEGFKRFRQRGATITPKWRGAKHG